MADTANAPVDAGAVPTPGDEQPGHKVFTGNLAYSTTEEGLKTFFNPVVDDILSVQLIYRGRRPAGYGFVAFNTAEAASKAAELLNKKELDGRTLIVEVAKPTDQKEKKEKRSPKRRPSKKGKSVNGEATTNGVTDAKESTEKAATSETQEGSPKPKKKRNARKTKKPKTAAKEGDATTAPADGTVDAPTTAESKPKKAKTPKAPKAPRPPKPVRPVGEAPEGEPSKTMLFVANLGFSVDDAGLSDLFTSAGITVVTARVVRRRWGHPRRSKGYGFVDVGSEDEQKKALELLQGKEVGGREIAVKIAVNAQEKEDKEESGAAENIPSLVTAAA
ncbi:RNA-binding domain-containing protein [Serendipita vermifera]|nr:RNA-binding domain-containing protein [Serendipita vermifera]